jgi:hypothetical protein
MNAKPTETAHAAMYHVGSCWMSTGTALQHQNGKVHVVRNGYVVDTYPYDGVLCRGDVVNRLAAIWAWAVNRLS